MNTHPHSFRFLTAFHAATLSVVLFLPTPAPAEVGLAWAQPTRGVSVALDAADNVYTVDYEQALGAEMTLTKRAANGTLLWVKSHDQTDQTQWERASWVATDSTGNAIVCGTLMSGYSNPVEAASIVVKFDPSGNLLWRHVYESSFDGSSVRKCLVDADDNAYVLGLGNGPAGRVTKVKKFAADGTALWSYFDSAGIGAPLNFKLTPDNALLISGKSITGSLMGYAKINLNNGQPIWSYPGVSSLTAGDSAGDAFGNTYLVHGEYVANGGTVIKKLDASGTLIWQQVYRQLSGFRVEVDSDNNAVVSGFPNTGTPGAAFIKVGDNSKLIWSNLDADGPLALLAHAHMRLDANNNAYLAAGTLSDMAVCKVNGDGTSGWTQTIAFGYAQAIALANTDNSVYVVGGTTARLGQGSVPTLPAAPSGLAYSLLTATSVDLNWTDNSSNEVGFTVERCAGTMLFCAGNPGAWSTRTTTAANATRFTDTGLAAGTAYVWRVKAYNTVGNSGYSNHLPATTPAQTAIPAAPSGLTQLFLTANSADLSWTDNSSNETGFMVERCTGTMQFCADNPGAWSARATIAANVPRFTDTSLAAGTAYVWRVKAYNTVGNSGYSNYLSATTPAQTAIPAAPTNLQAQAKRVGSRAEVRLIWSDNATNETGYSVERCGGSTCTNFSVVAILTANTVQYTDSGLARARTYRYRVIATGQGGNSPYSNVVTVKTP